jgi:hypothetical protein
MKLLISAYMLLFSSVSFGQTKTLITELQIGDSLVVYQCHVDTATVSMQTASGQTLSGSESLSSVTEKFVIKKTNAGYLASYYTSDYSTLPNRRFSGLKIREKEYWHFKYVGQKTLATQEMLGLLTLERSGREAIEYDYIISKHTRNQIIIKKRNDFEQLVIDSNQKLFLILGFN